MFPRGAGPLILRSFQAATTAAVLVLSLLCSYAVSAAAAVTAGNANGAPASIPLSGGGSAPGFPAFRFPEAPPDVVLPPGGTARVQELSDADGHSAISIFRSDGTLYARGTLARSGDYDEIALYDGRGRQYFGMSGDSAAPRRRNQFGRGSSDLLKPLPAWRQAREMREQAACGSNGGQYVDAGYRAPVLFPFYMNIATMPQVYWNSVFYAADNWNSLQNWCNTADQSALQLTYIDQTGRYFAHDGVNVVDFRPTVELGGACVNSVACANWWLVGNTVAEADVRFNSFTTWMYTGGPYNSAAIDVEGAVTHEFGHVIGLAHAGTSNEVMYYAQAAGGTSNRKLGRGDSNFGNLAY